jgi:hypothetical protein
MPAQIISIRASGPVSYVHQTGDGPVHLLVKASKTGWEALYWGNKVAGAWTYTTMAEANENVLRCFEKLYLGHECSSACRRVDSLDVHRSADVWGIIRGA